MAYFRSLWRTAVKAPITIEANMGTIAIIIRQGASSFFANKYKNGIIITYNVLIAAAQYFILFKAFKDNSEIALFLSIYLNSFKVLNASSLFSRGSYIYFQIRYGTVNYFIIEYSTFIKRFLNYWIKIFFIIFINYYIFSNSPKHFKNLFFI